MVANDFNVLRQAGMKAIVRMAYTNVVTNANGPYGDAPLSVASAHLDQLSPILKVLVTAILSSATCVPPSVARHAQRA